MAKIPQVPETAGQLSREVPGVPVQPGVFGRGGAGVTRLGEQVAEVGFRFAARAKQTRDLIEENNEMAIFRRESENLKRDLLFQADESGMVDFDGEKVSVSQAFSQRLNERFRESQDRLPSESARSSFVARATRFSASELTLVEASEIKLRRNAASEALVRNANSAGRALNQTGSTFHAETEAERHRALVDEQIKLGIFGETERRRLEDAGFSVIAETVVEGLLNSDQAAKALFLLDPNEARKISDPKLINQFTVQIPLSEAELLVEEGQLSPQIVEEARRSGEQSISVRYGDIEVTQDLVTVGRPQYMRGLDPSKQDELIRRTKAALKSQGRKQTFELSTRQRQMVSTAITRGGVDKADFQDLVSRILSNQSLDETRKSLLIMELTAANSFGREISQLERETPSQWNFSEKKIRTLMEKDLDLLRQEFPQLRILRDKSFIDASIAKFQKIFNSRISTLATQRRKNAATEASRVFADVRALEEAALGGDPTALQNYLNRVLQKQSELGIPGGIRQIFTKRLADAFSARLNSRNGATINSALLSMQRGFGDKFGKAFRELVSRRKVNSKLYSASFITDEVDRIELLSALNDPELKNKFKNSGTNLKLSDIDDRVRREVRPVFESLAGTDRSGLNSDIANGYFEAVKAQAMKNIIDGRADTATDAVRQAKGRIIDEQFQFIDSDRADLMIPKSIEGVALDAEFIEDTLEDAADEDFLLKQDLRLPPGIIESSAILRELREETDSKQRLAEMISDSAFFAQVSEEEVELRFIIPDRGERVTVFKSNGSPFRVRLIDIMNGNFRVE